MAIHARFDLQRWTREFPLEAARAAARAVVEEFAQQNQGQYESEAAEDERASLIAPSGDIIVGPESMAIAELLRREAGQAERLGRAVPVDMLVWGRGEAGNRAATKIGGLPYRPADAPWPRGHAGRPSVFLGQLCFADSRDVLGAWTQARPRLLGDVLLLFAPNEVGVWDADRGGEDECLQHEWWPLGLDRLVQHDQLPTQQWSATVEGGLEPCYAELHRTYDYPDVPDDHPLRRYLGADALCVLGGGKMGGVPHYVQEGASPRPGVYLCSLGSINPVGVRYPLLNVPQNPDGELDMDGPFLMFGDCGTLYLSVSERGVLRKRVRLHWDVQGY